jgi:hypothetical protein
MHCRSPVFSHQSSVTNLQSPIVFPRDTQMRSIHTQNSDNSAGGNGLAVGGGGLPFFAVNAHTAARRAWVNLNQHHGLLAHHAVNAPTVLAALAR